MLPETLLVGCKAKESQSIREHTDKVKAEAYRLIKLGCITSQRVGRLLIIACEYHDYGKVNREFVERIEKNIYFERIRRLPIIFCPISLLMKWSLTVKKII